ncbi:MAG: cohesin domain-containing protein [Clostridiales bacterium]|nr:cohesin domain-containing protein [Clostridiales bacterium]
MKKLIVFTLICLLTLGLYAPASHAAVPLSFSLSQPSGAVGDTVEVEIRVNASFTGKGGLISYWFRLDYDTNALQFVSSANGALAADFLSMSNNLLFTGVHTTGSKKSGVLYLVYFKILKETGGYLLLNGIDVSYLDENGQDSGTVYLDPVHGAVTVAGKPAPTVNPSAIPTQGPNVPTRTPNPNATPVPQITDEPLPVTPEPDVPQTEPPEEVTPPPIIDSEATPEPDEPDEPPGPGPMLEPWQWIAIGGTVVLAGAVLTILFSKKRR